MSEPYDDGSRELELPEDEMVSERVVDPTGTDEERRVRPGEGDGGVIGDGDGTEQREGGVLQLHGHALGGGGGRGDLQEVEVDDGIAAEDLAGGDAEEKGVGDLSGGAGDGHGDR